MDVLAMREATGEAVSAARSGGGPAFIEAKTFRFHGHSLADPVNYREKNEEEEWRRRDPIVTFGAELVRQGYATDDELTAIQATQDGVVQDAIQFAVDSPEPDIESLFEGIYADAPPESEVRAESDL
jgi:pyruvate dehydrogenase E1 component alpha subunit